MSACPSCGNPLSGYDAERGVCGHHLTAAGDDWAIANRIMCDFVHRAIVPPPVVLQLLAESWVESGYES